jgi:hypothetical protein
MGKKYSDNFDMQAIYMRNIEALIHKLNKEVKAATDHGVYTKPHFKTINEYTEKPETQISVVFNVKNESK